MFSDNGILNLDDGRQCYAMFDKTLNNVSVVTIVLKKATEFDFTHNLIKQIRVQKEGHYTIPIFVNFVPMISNVLLYDALVIDNDLHMITRLPSYHDPEPLRRMLENNFKVTYEENVYGIQNINIRKISI